MLHTFTQSKISIERERERVGKEIIGMDLVSFWPLLFSFVMTTNGLTVQLIRRDKIHTKDKTSVTKGSIQEQAHTRHRESNKSSSASSVW